MIKSAIKANGKTAVQLTLFPVALVVDVKSCKRNLLYSFYTKRCCDNLFLGKCIYLRLENCLWVFIVLVISSYTCGFAQDLL